MSALPTLCAKQLLAVAYAIFTAGFADGEDRELIAEKWFEWDADRTACIRKARAALRQ